MKTITKTVYEFNELNDAAKEKARQWWREGEFDDPFWSECVIEDAETCAEMVAIFDFMKTEKLNGQRIACYDNGGKTCDRFTVIYLDEPERKPNLFSAVAMNHEPFYPQGFGQHCTAMPGRHLGRRIAFATLPKDCQKLVQQDTRQN